jgi:hypothetical protein
MLHTVVLTLSPRWLFLRLFLAAQQFSLAASPSLVLTQARRALSDQREEGSVPAVLSGEGGEVLADHHLPGRL